LASFSRDKQDKKMKLTEEEIKERIEKCMDAFLGNEPVEVRDKIKKIALEEALKRNVLKV